MKQDEVDEEIAIDLAIPFVIPLKGHTIPSIQNLRYLSCLTMRVTLVQTHTRPRTHAQHYPPPLPPSLPPSHSYLPSSFLNTDNYRKKGRRPDRLATRAAV